LHQLWAIGESRRRVGLSGCKKLRRGWKGTECDVLNVRRDEGRRCETNTKVDVKLR